MVDGLIFDCLFLIFSMLILTPLAPVRLLLEFADDVRFKENPRRAVLRPNSIPTWAGKVSDVAMSIPIDTARRNNILKFIVGFYFNCASTQTGVWITKTQQQQCAFAEFYAAVYGDLVNTFE